MLQGELQPPRRRCSPQQPTAAASRQCNCSTQKLNSVARAISRRTKPSLCECTFAAQLVCHMPLAGWPACLASSRAHCPFQISAAVPSLQRSRLKRPRQGHGWKGPLPNALARMGGGCQLCAAAMYNRMTTSRPRYVLSGHHPAGFLASPWRGPHLRRHTSQEGQGRCLHQGSTHVSRHQGGQARHQACSQACRICRCCPGVSWLGTQPLWPGAVAEGPAWHQRCQASCWCCSAARGGDTQTQQSRGAYCGRCAPQLQPQLSLCVWEPMDSCLPPAQPCLPAWPARLPTRHSALGRSRRNPMPPQSQ